MVLLNRCVVRVCGSLMDQCLGKEAQVGRADVCRMLVVHFDLVDQVPLTLLHQAILLLRCCRLREGLEK